MVTASVFFGYLRVEPRTKYIYHIAGESSIVNDVLWDSDSSRHSNPFSFS